MPSYRKSWRRSSPARRRRPIPAGSRRKGWTSSAPSTFRNLHTVELKPWARRGGRGVFINHDASRTSNDCYVCEIPSGGKLAPQRQLFEEMILILDGRGSTSVWNDAGKKVTFEWQKGSLFAIPLNAWHQHFNGSGQQPARYVAVTNFPPVMNLYEDEEFLFNIALRVQEPLRRRAGLFRQSRRAEGPAAADQLRRRRHQPAADRGQGARRRRRPYPLQHGARLDEQPHLPVPGRHLQEGPPARAGRACHHTDRRRATA